MACRPLAARVHLRVAMRKLRHQTQDSFPIVPMEDGLWVRDNPPTARWSQPRLGSALRFLFDLGLLKLDEKEDDRPYRLDWAGSQWSPPAETRRWFWRSCSHPPRGRCL